MGALGRSSGLFALAGPNPDFRSSAVADRHTFASTYRHSATAHCHATAH